jgi:hypothetical protein
MCSETVKPNSSRRASLGAERRKEVRYKFAASAELVADTSGEQIEGRVSDISQQGCFLDTKICFPMGTVAKIRITREGKYFEARVKVVFSQATKGMGLLFAAIAPTQLPTLEGWISSSRETSWHAASRRRSQRIVLQVPVRITTPEGAARPFEEESSTLVISAHGALILLSERVKKGQHLILFNPPTDSSMECIVAHIGDAQGERLQIGVAFVMSSSAFWHVNFPPADWTSRHEDAKQPAAKD